MELPVLTLCEILSVLRSTMGFLTQFIVYFVMSFNIPLISNHLTDLGYSPVFMGGSMITATTFYILSMPVVSILTKQMSKKGILFMGLAFQITGCLVSGIDNIEKWYYPGVFTIFGLSLMGFGSGAAIIPIMPEIIEGIESDQRFAKGYDELILQNNLAGYFICCQAIGEALGPLMSSLLERGIEFRPTQKALCLSVTVFLFTYVMVCGACDFFTYKAHVKQFNNNQELKIKEIENTTFEDAETSTNHDDPIISI